jgi:hypothetical protein
MIPYDTDLTWFLGKKKRGEGREEEEVKIEEEGRRYGGSWGGF